MKYKVFCQQKADNMSQAGNCNSRKELNTNVKSVTKTARLHRNHKTLHAAA